MSAEINALISSGTFVLLSWPIYSLFKLRSVPIQGICKNKANLKEFDSCDRPINITQIGYKSSFFLWPWNLMDDLKKFGSNLVIFLSRVTLKFHGWPWKATGHLFQTRSSFVLHFKVMDALKLELQPGKSQFWSKCVFFGPVWSWNSTGDLEKQQVTSSILWQALCIISKPSVNSNLSHSPETVDWGQNRWIFVLRIFKIWWMTLESNKAPLLCCFQFCASFHSHQWIQTRFTIRKEPIWVKSDYF